MNFFRNLRIVQKLALGFGLMFLLQAIVALSSRLSFSAIQESTNSLQKDGVINSMEVGAIEADVLNYRMLHYRIMLAKTAPEANKLLADLAKTGASVDQHCAELEKRFTDAKQKELFSAFQKGWKRYVETDGPFIEASKLNDKKKLDEVAPVLRGIWTTDLSPALVNFLANNKKHVAAITAQSEQSIQSAHRAGIIVFTLSLLAALFLGFNITRNLTQPISLLAKAFDDLQSKALARIDAGAKALAQGDMRSIELDVLMPIEWTSKDELGQMCETANKMISQASDTAYAFRTAQQQFGELVSTVTDRAFQVASSGDQMKSAVAASAEASQEISSKIAEITVATEESAKSTEHIAKGSEQLAQSSSEASAHLERLTSQAEEIAESSVAQQKQVEKANELTDTVSQALGETLLTVEATRNQVEVTRLAVEQLAQKQTQIGAIVQTIETIAEQTNLLALNAAIEAARAGEHGRGFAVVADEVRKLAENSGNATQEIAELINSVKHDVERASLAMDETAKQVDAVVENSANAQSSLAQIRAAGQETVTISKTNAKNVHSMTTAVNEVSSLVAKVASFAQQSAAGSQELSATTQQMARSAADAAQAVHRQVTSFSETDKVTQSLGRHSDELTVLVAKFRTGRKEDVSSQFYAFRKAHMRWCDRVKDMLEGGDLIRREELTSHTDCALGRWYNAEGAQRYGHLASFKALAAPHDRVHANAAKALDAMEKGNLSAARTAYDEICKAKDQVVACLEEVEQQASHETRRAA